MEPKSPDVTPSRTFKFSGTTSLYVTLGFDDLGAINGLFVSAASSGSTLHGVCNALGRSISIALQNRHHLFSEMRKAIRGLDDDAKWKMNEALNRVDERATLVQIIQSLEGFSSESVWMNDKIGRVMSIPAAVAGVLQYHMEEEDSLEHEAGDADVPEPEPEPDKAETIARYDAERKKRIPQHMVD